MEQLINLGFFLVLLALGYGFGQMAERRHFKSIIEREKQLQAIYTYSKRFPHSLDGDQNAALVCGSMVISIDYFKRVVAGLRSLIGGRVTAYESLLERARREAILRMKAEAKARGGNLIVNVKIETASITKGQQQQVGCVEVLAYGTALTHPPST